jgi:hypothetical protein
MSRANPLQNLDEAVGLLPVIPSNSEERIKRVWLFPNSRASFIVSRQ